MRPGLLSAPHAVEVLGLTRVEVGGTAPGARGLRSKGDLPVQPLGDGEGLRAVVIATAAGEIRLTGD